MQNLVPMVLTIFFHNLTENNLSFMYINKEKINYFYKNMQKINKYYD